MRRHLMPLCKQLGFPLQLSQLVVFLVSAIAHELPLMVSMASSFTCTYTNSQTHQLEIYPLIKYSKQVTFRTWEAHGFKCLFGVGFWAMMVQVPLALITPHLFLKTKTGALLGNAFSG